MHYRSHAETVGTAQIFSERFVPARLQVVILWTIDASVLAELDLGLFHCDFDHSYDVITLVGHQSRVDKSFVIELDCETILIVAFVNSFDC